MAGQSTSTLSALLKPNVEGGVYDLVYRQTDFINVLRAAGSVQESIGSSPISWNVVTAANGSAETFAEGQAPPAAGRQTFVQSSLPVFYVRGVYGRTGHQRDNEAHNGYWANPSTIEGQLLQSDVMKKLEDTLVGSTQDQGIASIVSASGTYAGLAQGTYSIWASQVDTSIGVLSNNAMATLYTELTSAAQGGVARGASPTHWLMPANQVQNYAATVGVLATSGSLVRIPQGPGFEAGVIGIPGGAGGPATGLTCMGLPIMRVRGITSTEIYLLDMTDVSLVIHRDLQVDPIVGNPEQDQWQLSMGVGIQVRHRNQHGKMTGVTA